MGSPVGSRARRASWLPPGQYDIEDVWPVLSAELTPDVPTDTWTFTVEGLVERPTTWTWDEMHALPQSTYEGDIHCVTVWSKHDMQFSGVSVDVLLEAAGVAPIRDDIVSLPSLRPATPTNLPLADVNRGQAWVVFEADGERLSADHGGPARLLVPHLYFWKSVKWVSGLTVLDHDEPGFWETQGYHNHGDPWREERYTGD